MARSFASASSQYLRIASNLGELQNPLTFHCWFNSTNMTSAQILMSLCNIGAATGRYSLAIRGDLAGDPVRVFKDNDSNISGSANTTTGYSSGVWGAAAAVFASNTSRTVYNNGGGSASNTSNISNPTPDVFLLGAQEINSGTQLYTDGIIAFPAVWNIALPAAAILMLAKGAHPLSVYPDNLIAFWPLDEKTGGARDIVGGYNLTASASEPTWAPDPPVLVRRPRRRIWVAMGGGGNITLAADTGTFALSGQAASPLVARNVAADAGAFALAGQAASPLVSRAVAADTGAFALSGQQAGMVAARTVAADTGAFSLAGIDAGVIAGRRVAADSGGFAVGGQSADLAASRIIGADTGTFALDGIPAGLFAARIVTADFGAFVVTGYPADLGGAAGITLTAEAGAFGLSGQAADLLAARRVAADAGAFVVAGSDAALPLAMAAAMVPTVRLQARPHPRRLLAHAHPRTLPAASRGAA